MDRASRRRQKLQQPTVVLNGKHLIACAYCSAPGGTLRRAPNGLSVHQDCFVMYTIAHEDDEPDAKHERRLSKQARRLERTRA